MILCYRRIQKVHPIFRVLSQNMSHHIFPLGFFLVCSIFSREDEKAQLQDGFPVACAVDLGGSVCGALAARRLSICLADLVLLSSFGLRWWLVCFYNGDVRTIPSLVSTFYASCIVSNMGLRLGRIYRVWVLAARAPIATTMRLLQWRWISELVPQLFAFRFYTQICPFASYVVCLVLDYCLTDSRSVESRWSSGGDLVWNRGGDPNFSSFFLLCEMIPVASLVWGWRLEAALSDCP